MILKSYKDPRNEIIVTRTETGVHNVVMLSNNRPADYQSGLDLESALDVFDVYLEKIVGEEK